MAREPVLERAVMRVLWASQEAMTPRRVREALRPAHDVAYTTVTTVLTRLWKKDMLVREPDGNSYRYRPRESHEEYAARRMEEILDAASDRSLTLSRFMGKLSGEDLDALREIDP